MEEQAATTGASREQQASTRELCLQAHACMTRGIPRGTLSHDSSGFNWVMRFGRAHGLTWMRPFFVPAALEHVQRLFVALFVFWIAGEMPPAPQRARMGYTDAQPSR